jgi:Cdc6-like AAA superfamily ATPase
VIVLENVEAFAGKGKQTFLYSLLDKVHTNERRYSIVMTTSRLNVGEMMERRIRSRSEIVSVFVGRIGVEEICDVVGERVTGWRGKTKGQVVAFLRGSRNGPTLTRAWSLGRGTGWFINVARLWVGWAERGEEEGRALDRALAAMGHNMVPGGLPPCSHVGNLRVLTMENLTLDQIIILVAAWKVEERNLRREDYVKGVTFLDVAGEVADYRRTRSAKAAGQFQAERGALFRAFRGLHELGMVKFADRHMGGKPLVYGHERRVEDGDYESVKGRRMHVTVDWNEEGKEWIRRGGRATTAVREWALKG